MHRVDLIEMLPAMQEMLNAGGEVTFTVEGRSMLPTMTGGRDSVTLVKPKGRLKKYDIPLYRRDNGKFVLHRVVKVTKSGYVMCGDNQYAKEYDITDAHIIGLVTAFKRNGKQIRVKNFFYKLYSHLFCCPLAKFIKHVKTSLKCRYRSFMRKVNKRKSH